MDATASATLKKSRNEKEVWKCGQKKKPRLDSREKNKVFQLLPVWPNKMEFSPRYETLEYTAVLYSMAQIFFWFFFIR